MPSKPISQLEIEKTKMYLGGYFDRGETYRAQLNREVREYSYRPFGGP